MTVETKLLIISFIAGASTLVYVVTRVLGTWFDHHLERHNLIVASKLRRLEYYQALAARDNPEENVIVEDEEQPSEQAQAPAPPNLSEYELAPAA